MRKYQFVILTLFGLILSASVVTPPETLKQIGEQIEQGNQATAERLHFGDSLRYILWAHPYEEVIVRKHNGSLAKIQWDYRDPKFGMLYGTGLDEPWQPIGEIANRITAIWLPSAPNYDTVLAAYNRSPVK